MKAKFFSLFRVLYPVSKQTYKLKLPKKEKIHNVFYVSLLKKNITKKRAVNNMQLKFEVINNEKYKIDGIWNSVFYAKELAIRQLLKLYYLVLWKSYPEDKNI